MARKHSHRQHSQTPSRKFDRSTPVNSLTKLIEQDAPLHSGSLLVLMYGPFQAVMAPGAGKGIASWLKEQVALNGFPSLVRFGSHHRAQVFRLDQLQPVLESLITKG